MVGGIILRLLLLLGLSSFPSITLAQIPRAVDGDETLHAALLGVTISAPIAEQFDVFALGGYRVGEFNFGFATAGVKYNPNRNLSFAAAYLGLYLESSSNRPNPRDNRLRLDTEIRYTFGKVNLQHRQRFEYQASDTGNSWRWRPEIQASTTFKVGGRNISPFALIEPIYDLQSNTVTTVLTRFGASIPMDEGFAIEPSFLRATVNGGIDLNFYTVFLKYRF